MPTKPTIPPTTEIVFAHDGTFDMDLVFDTIRAGGRVHIAERDNEAIQREIFDRITSGTTVEEVFGSDSTLKADDILNEAFELREVTYQNSDYDDQEGGCGLFSVLQTSLGVVVCGGRDIVVKTLQAKRVGLLPTWLKITKSRSAKYDVLNLVQAEAPKQAEEMF